LKHSYSTIHKLMNENKIRAAHSIRGGGIAEAISKMSFGNRIGFIFESIDEKILFQPSYGSLLLEISADDDHHALFQGLDYTIIGCTQGKEMISVNGVNITLEEALNVWEKPLEQIFPAYAKDIDINIEPKLYNYEQRYTFAPSIRVAAPKIFIPVFPGTNCEYDSARAFEKAGGRPDVMVIRNLTSGEIDESLQEMARRISDSQIIMIPGGFSGGDEPDGSGKFIAAAFRNPRVKDAVMELLKNRDGLILGICNGFQALIKLGLVPYGEIMDIESSSPTLTFNTIGRHVSKMVETRVSSVLSPWLSHTKVGDIHAVPVSHGEGRFVVGSELLKLMDENGQIATQYVDPKGNLAKYAFYNPNGSFDAIEGITSPDGRIFGKMAHSERLGNEVAKNIPGNKDQKVFQSGIDYFK